MVGKECIQIKEKLDIPTQIIENIPTAGTTTATILARSIVKEGRTAVAAGMNPMDLRRGIQMAADKVVEEM